MVRLIASFCSSGNFFPFRSSSAYASIRITVISRDVQFIKYVQVPDLAACPLGMFRYAVPMRESACTTTLLLSKKKPAESPARGCQL
jgi:hypothetical protein